MTFLKIKDITKQWINSIKQNHQYKDIEDSDFITKDTILVSPFNFFDTNDNFVILNHKNKKYYIEIVDESFIKMFANKANIKSEKYVIKDPKPSNDKIWLEKEINMAAKENNNLSAHNLINNWLNSDNYKQNKQFLSITELPIDRIIEISPYNYSHIDGNKLYLLTNANIKVYRIIYAIETYNRSMLKDINDKRLRKLFMQKLKASDEYKLVGINSKINRNFQKGSIKQSQTPNSLTEIIKTHDDRNAINDIWTTNETLENKIIKIDRYQQAALDMIMQNNVNIITGYAGTGKSLIIQQISLKLEKDGWIISRVAPTGRASQIISGKTIHSWLEPIVREYPGNKYKIIGFAKRKMQEKECLVIDESSMIDNEIWTEIRRVWNNSVHLDNKKIIIVGDPGQLEPVGEGRPFMNMIESNKYPTANLKIIHRNSENSDIVSMASFVRMHGYIDQNNKYDNIEFIDAKEAIARVAKDTSIQLITPKRIGPLGAIAINNQIKKLMNFNSSPDFFTLVWNNETHKYEDNASIHINDKVIIINNIWEWNITNGTIGKYLGKTKKRLYNYVSKKYSNQREVFIFINPETNKKFYLPNTKSIKTKIELAYAITIHKSQGSEYNSPILYLPYGWIHKKMLYTAITRAKHKLVIAYYDDKKQDTHQW